MAGAENEAYGVNRNKYLEGNLLFSFGFFGSFLVGFFLNAFLAFSQLLAQEFK